MKKFAWLLATALFPLTAMAADAPGPDWAFMTPDANAPAPRTRAAEVPLAPTVTVPVDPAQHPGAVASPMVGTAYLGTAPGARPFVEVGSRVKAGEPLMIIEAMKTMNQIPAPRSGTVIQILIEDGQPVEYGAPLMIIE